MPPVQRSAAVRPDPSRRNRRLIALPDSRGSLNGRHPLRRGTMRVGGRPMTLQHRPDDERLIGDAERAAAEAQLREACVDGRLTLTEFSDRMDAALVARTAGQLCAATRDLPA